MKYPIILDLEFGCLTNAENLAKKYPQLQYVEGWCRLPKNQWGAHAWCQTKTGTIVDPFFEHTFGNKQKRLEYKKAKPMEDPFDRGYGWLELV